MAQQFIQSTQLPEIQGTAGPQTVVQDTSPTVAQGIGGAINNVGNILDAAGTVFAQNRAQVLANEAIESVDAAISAASTATTPSEFAPEGVDLDDSEWQILQNAVASGKMSREKARLVASSRLRTRISEQPLFADRLRQAASQVLGFNIESEPAQAYFASLPTEASLGASGRQTAIQKAQEQAALISSTGEVSYDTAYRNIVSTEIAAINKTLAEERARMGASDAGQFTNAFVSADSESAWATTMGDVLALRAEGQAVDNIEFGNLIAQKKLLAVKEWERGYEAAGGQIGSTDYERQKAAVLDTYDRIGEYVETVGIDNMTQQRLDRDSRLRELWGNQYFGKYKAVAEVMGAETANTLFNRLADIQNESQRQLLLARNPVLKSLYAFLGDDTQAFTDLLSDSVSKMFNPDAELTAEEGEAVDAILPTLYADGDVETQGSIIQALADRGAPFKAFSLAAGRSPTRASQEARDAASNAYNLHFNDLSTQLGQLQERASRTMARFGEGIEAIRFNVADDGSVQVVLPQLPTGTRILQPSAARNVQRGLFDEASAIASKLNQFAKGINNGWGSVLGVSREDYALNVNRNLREGSASVRVQEEQAAAEASTQRFQESFNEVTSLIHEGQDEKASTLYNSLREQAPDRFTTSWENIRSEIRRRAGL